MKNRKILNLRTHIGGLHGKNSYDAVKDKAVFELCQAGVIVDIEGRQSVLVPWPNCIELVISEALPEQKK